MNESSLQTENLFERIQGLEAQREPERRSRAGTEPAIAGTLDLIEIVGKKLQPQVKSINSFADRLLSGTLSAAQRRDAEVLAGSAQRILGELAEVLDFSDLETGDAVFAVERFDLHALVKDMASVLQSSAAEKGLTSGVEMAANCPRYIVGDERRVRQVLTALIESSLQSTEEGSIRLYLSVNDASSPVAVRFDITDTSAGFSPAEQRALFQPSVDTLRSDGGLGLPIAQRVAEAMGGVAGCDSALGQGTLYWFTFMAVIADDVSDDIVETEGEDVSEANGNTYAVEPEAESPAECATEPKEAEKDAEVGADTKSASSNSPLAGHVLVVESNTVNRLLIGAYLEEFGLSYDEADSGAAALMCLSGRGYDLVLMNACLPDYDGERMAQRIRSLQAPASDVAVVAITAKPDQDNGQALVEAGVNASVAKPIQGQALYAALVPFLPAQDRKAEDRKVQDRKDVVAG